jgi:hypothetical protein
MHQFDAPTLIAVADFIEELGGCATRSYLDVAITSATLADGTLSGFAALRHLRG